MIHKRGMHPDHPYPASDMSDAREYSTERVACPNCGRSGGHEYAGHATLASRTAGGEARFLDAVCVECGKCGSPIPVYHQAYGDWTSTVAAAVDSNVVAGAGWYPISSIGLQWEAWLPAQIVAAQRRTQPETENPPETLTGPVTIYSGADPDLPADENGCGHFQYHIIGPSMQQIFSAILNTPAIAERAQGRGRCFTCGNPLKNMWLLIEASQLQPFDAVQLARLDCRIKRMEDGFAKNLISMMDEATLAEGRKQAYYLAAGTD